MRQYCRVLTALVVVMMVGCSENDPATDSIIDKETTIKFSEGSTPAPSITEKGGSTQLKFVATKPWSISLINSRSDSWLSVYPTSGDAGNVVITIAA